MVFRAYQAPTRNMAFLQGCRVAMVAAVAAICCHLLMPGAVPAHAKTEVSHADTAAFWDEILNEQYKGQDAEELPQLMKVTLNKYARDNKLRRYAKAGAIGTGAAGVLLGALTPLLREWGARKQESVDAIEQSEKEHAMKVQESEEAAGTLVPSWHPSPPSTTMGQLREYVSGPKANWGKRLWKASGALSAVLMLSAIGLYIAKHAANQKIQDDRRKYRKILADQRKQMMDPDEQGLASSATGDAAQPSAGQDQVIGSWRRPEFPVSSTLESAMKAAQDVVQAAQEGGAAPEGAAAKPETTAGGVFIGTNEGTDAEKQLSNDDVRRLIELAKELGKPAVFYP